MRTIVITGASRGIGAATALLAAKSGYSVVVNYLNYKEGAEVVANEIERLGSKAFVIQGDISKPDEIVNMFSRIDRECGPIYGLVNNAGILEPQMSVESMDRERLMRVMQTNVIGTILCAKEAVTRMSIKYGGMGGAIVNVSSIAAKTGSPFEYVDYAASKGAIDTFTVGLAKEVAAEGIRVNAVRPGLVYTDIHTSGGESDRVERLKSKIPLKRGGKANEVAEAILWLLSSKASFTTGSFIDVSGGL
ncbi:SDR family oxidoreductase [Algoriphagus sp. AGSA1]|uniref:SDR family oxidoreductase n=1 Tax=Algoriphagus sp. AGSA1 TaxID=2907213 RepID=UPI001F405FA0|nr:SDR family oxidoreductase [Algoriphagus sp. AGSA1]MCE7055230.1 SDR family oxidoreductase [Algoriphagus sp. AGSA1]